MSEVESESKSESESEAVKHVHAFDRDSLLLRAIAIIPRGRNPVHEFMNSLSEFEDFKGEHATATSAVGPVGGGDDASIFQRLAAGLLSALESKERVSRFATGASLEL